MKARFLADADLHPGIVTGLRSRNSEIDFQLDRDVMRDGFPDPLVLAFAASHGRVLVSHDVNTMRRHFREFISAQPSPGLILIPQRLAIGVAIEELELVWECTEDAELQNRLIYLPL